MLLLSWLVGWLVGWLGSELTSFEGFLLLIRERLN
jgi:hypothetical protein